LKREENIMKQLALNNEIIHKKNEDITASILYAQRIQQSLMDSENKLKSMFPSSFVYYVPKDMVSGDFYWVQSLNEACTKIAVAAADCTGHGVPGALVSVLGITYLREIVNSKEDIEPNEILEELNKKVINTFKTKGKGMTSKDGMDISVAIIDLKKKSLCFSGAYRPLIIIRNSELIEIPGDKQPIGSDHFIEERKFTNHELKFEDGDWLYMFSDGYVDQFGGDRKRKFMKKQFKELLISMCQKTCDAQCEILDKEMTNWKGDMDQIDDITVLGLHLQA
jgi:serine phosphatase RsbU (regulator of sigma subunit)